MKGAVFIAFNQMVEDNISIDIWEQLLTETQSESGGVYTSIDDYKDEELFAFVGKLSEIVDVPVETLVEQFGHYLFSALNGKYPIFSQQQPDFFSFIKSIDEVIHKEVRKLYDNPNLPTLECEDVDEKTLLVKYYSPRKLCLLAEGLIRGAAQHYKTEYTLEHEVCMHKGADQCLLRLSIA